MSGRGGRGPGGRGQPSQSRPPGGGGGGGGAGGRGRGRGPQYSAPPPSSPYNTPRPPVVQPQTPFPSMPSSSATPAHQPSSSSGGTGVQSLTREVEKLTLVPAAASMAPPLPPSSSKAVRFPQRPGMGTVGKKCLVRANHFLVKVADSDLHHYDVSITPEVISKKVNRDIMTELVVKYRQSHLGGRMPAYDGRKSLYTAGALPFESKEFVVKLIDKDRGDSSSGSARKERQFKVAIKLASKPDLHYLWEFLSRRHFEAPQETIQVLDVVLRAKPSEMYTVVGRSFFSTSLGTPGDLGDGVEYWMGYYQSLRPTQMGLSLNIDLSARSFYEPVLVTEFISRHFRKRDLTRPLSDQDRVKVKKALKGVRVELRHMNYVKTSKIVSISNVPLSQLTFTLDDKKSKVSVVQYFREKYSISLKYPNLPALQSGTDTKPIYLPMELCWIVKGQRYTKKLNDLQVRNLLKATCQRPHDRESNIKKMVEANGFNMDQLVNKEFGIQVQSEPAVVNARVLPAPRLNYHESGREKSVNPGFGSWNMINKKLVNGGRVDSWTCVNFSSDGRLTDRFCTELVKMCNSKGMEFCLTPSIGFRNARPERIEQTLIEVHEESTDKKRPLQLLIIILPDQSGSYGKIKRICETVLGIVTQCCQPKQASRLSPQYLENLSLKINVKAGGRNTVLDDAIQKRIPLVTDRPTIIFGADVTHPQPGEDSSPSIAAVVASMDWPHVTKYRGIVSAQPHREEIIQDLYKTYQDPQKGVVHAGMIRELLVAFYKLARTKPHRIIFYRDGVSEGQFSQVLLHEMDAIRKACNSLEENYLPPVTFVVVQKRHHTRLFPTDRNFADKSGNIQAGTVVDTQICHPTEFDFYLNSHAGIQGTSKPTHYHVLYDENKFSADIMQVLTNNLCYTFARCTRSVSIVPPAYYAHLAAFRARYYMEDDVSDSGSTGGGRLARERNVEVRPLPSIKDNVKDVMFYC